jgi:hypothetical protein
VVGQVGGRTHAARYAPPHVVGTPPRARLVKCRWVPASKLGRRLPCRLCWGAALLVDRVSRDYPPPHRRSPVG